MANVSSSNGLEKHPKLRFKGFSEPWKTVRIGEVYAERSERGAEDMELLSVTMNDGVKMRSDIEGKDNSSEDKSNYKIVRAGDMVYNSMRMWQGANGISPWDGIVSPAYTVLKPRMPISNGFFAALFKTHRLINEFRKNSQGMTSDTWNLKYPQIETIKTCIPALAEQEKIADFLMALDQRIEKQRTLVEHLKKYKRGVMREIFETKTLFSSHHYSLVQLGNECRFFSGGTPQSGNSKYYGGSIPFIRSGEVHKSITELTLTEEGLNNSSAKMVEVGDLIMALYGATSGEVDISKISGAINQAILCIRPNTINRHYLKFLFECKKEDILKTYLQGGQGNLSAEIIKKLYFEIPLPSEQQETVDFLVALENKISLEDSKLEKLFSVRNGLLQQLFI